MVGSNFWCGKNSLLDNYGTSQLETIALRARHTITWTEQVQAVFGAPAMGETLVIDCGTGPVEGGTPVNAESADVRIGAVS